MNLKRLTVQHAKLFSTYMYVYSTYMYVFSTYMYVFVVFVYLLLFDITFHNFYQKLIK